MKKRPYIIALVIIVASASYFLFSAEKEIKSGLSDNKKPATDLKQSGEPIHSDSLSGASVKYPASADNGKNVTIQPDLKINPEHGQPGHRCDIKTGDPLPPGSSVTPQMSISPPEPQNAPAATATGSGPLKRNPAHGEPGHRCDIEVGAPFPSS